MDLNPGHIAQSPLAARSGGCVRAAARRGIIVIGISPIP